MNRETIRTNSARIAAIPDGLTDSVNSERGGPPVKRAIRNEATLDLTGERVRGMGD